MRRYAVTGLIREDENITLQKNDVRGRIEEPTHTHDFIEIVYILSGRGRHCVNNTWYSVERGNVLFINFGQTHAFSSEEGMEYYNCLISPEFIDRELIHSENAFEILALSSFEDFDLGADKLIPMLRFAGRDMLAVEGVLQSMLDEFEQKPTNYKTALKGYLLVLLTKIFRAMAQVDSAHILRQMDRSMPDILRYIEENLFERISLTELAQKCFYNPSYFSRVFKDCYGKNLTRFIYEKRMLEAERLLGETERSVEDIMSAVGYHDRKQFYKLFREHAGMTPGAYRAMRRSAEQG